MKEVTLFLRQFLKAKGHFVFLSLLVAKLCGLLGSVLLFRLLDKQEMGAISILMSLSAIFLAFSGFGSQQGLLRYGSLTENQEDRDALSLYLFRKGFLYHLLLSALFLATSVFYIQKYEHILYLFVFFTVRLVGFYFYNFVQSQLRINHNNRGFAKLNNVVNISGLVSMMVLTYFWGLYGYLISLMLTPFISLFWLKQIQTTKRALIVNKRELWNYNLQSGSTALLSDALFSLDIILLGFLINETVVADYRAAILLPANVTFIAVSFMQSDFPNLSKHHKDKTFLIRYIRNYYKVFIPICLFIFGCCYFIRDELVRLVSGNRYDNLGTCFMILLSAFLLNMLFRNLYGNLLSAVGLMKINTLVSGSALLVLTLLSLLIVPKYGVIGMAIAQALSLQFTGLVLWITFKSYLKKI